MAIKFKKDGTIVCNSIKYNWKQARNMVADSNGDQVSGVWVTSGDVEVVTSGDNHSNTYKSWRA